MFLVHLKEYSFSLYISCFNDFLCRGEDGVEELVQEGAKMPDMVTKRVDLLLVALKVVKLRFIDVYQKLVFIISSNYTFEIISISKIFCSARDIQYLSIQKIQNFIDMGRLAAKPNDMLTIRDLLAAGVITQYREGLKLLSDVILIFFFPSYITYSILKSYTDEVSHHNSTSSGSEPSI